MSSTLDIDSDKRTLWQDRLDHLAPFPTAWVANPSPNEKSKVQVLLAQEYPKYFPGSLNPLDFYALWPGAMSVATPQLRTIARQTVAAMGVLGRLTLTLTLTLTLPLTLTLTLTLSLSLTLP